MTLRLDAAGVRLVLLDIEGTTTPVSFVADVLFPFARQRLRAWLDTRAGSDSSVANAIDALGEERRREPPDARPPAWSDEGTAQRLESAAVYAHWLMDRDRKSPALKTLQGLVWEDGYRSGALVGQVYPDVKPALERWRRAGVGAGIYSSGSGLAQQLLFGRSTAGDLTPLLAWHFDTAVGPKVEPSSYARIATLVAIAPQSILFVSDAIKEIEAARSAGMQTALCVRDDAPAPDGWPGIFVRSFDEIV